MEMRLVVTPKLSTFNSSLTVSQMICSVSVAGATMSSALISGTGNTLRLIFPLGVRGMDGSCI